MVAPELTIPRYISLKNHPNIDERWLEDRLIENTELLGLGELDVLTRQRTQPSGGRLDLLLYDREQDTRYEVEIHLGSVDISFQPDESSSDVQEAQITVGILVEAREHSAKMLRLVEKALYQMALPVYVFVIRILPLPIGYPPARAHA